jgi:hypothetical protein
MGAIHNIVAMEFFHLIGRVDIMEQTIGMAKPKHGDQKV